MDENSRVWVSPIQFRVRWANIGSLRMANKTLSWLFIVLFYLIYIYIYICRTLLEKQGRTHKWCTLMAMQKQDDQHEHTFSSSARMRDIVQKTCVRRWTIGKSGERMVRDIRATSTTWWWWWWCIYIYIYIIVKLNKLLFGYYEFIPNSLDSHHTIVNCQITVCRVFSIILKFD